jgi:hypothetical protein
MAEASRGGNWAAGKFRGTFLYISRPLGAAAETGEGGFRIRCKIRCKI